MISRERVIRTLNFRPIDRAPRDLWLLPEIEVLRADDVAEMSVRFPADVLHVGTRWPAGKRSKEHGRETGTQTDAWGCTWKLDEHGAATGLVGSPLAGVVDVAKYEPPLELLDPARFAKINSLCEGTRLFTLARSEIRPLDRLRQLRGPETADAELGDDNRELRALLGKLHACFRREAELWARTQVDGVVLGDDLSWVTASRPQAKLWRSLFKPLFREYCSLLHRHDKFVFFLSEGPSGEVFDDLVAVGVDAIHAQWSHEELERLAARHRRRVTFWGGVERAKIEPPSQCDEIRDAVFRARKALDYGDGGVISQVAWGGHVPLRHIVTFFERWLVPLSVTV